MSKHKSNFWSLVDKWMHPLLQCKASMFHHLKHIQPTWLMERDPSWELKQNSRTRYSCTLCGRLVSNNIFYFHFCFFILYLGSQNDICLWFFLFNCDAEKIIANKSECIFRNTENNAFKVCRILTNIQSIFKCIFKILMLHENRKQ